MKTRLLTLPFYLLITLFVSTRGFSQNLIQGTIKAGPGPNQIEIWLKPNFDNSTRYLIQMGFPIAWPASASQPSPLTASDITFDPDFVTNFGNYTKAINPVANNTGNTEKYTNIVITRDVNSTPQDWDEDLEFKVLTVTFKPTGSPGTQVKFADYQDGGSDGQGFFYTVDGSANYYYSTTSIDNFYPTPGQSTIGGNASAAYSQTIALISLPVHLVSFSGYKNGDNNILNWTTGDELNSKGFEVQRSTNGIDYTAIGFVYSRAANGNNNGSLNYTYDDKGVSGNKQYYRLRQVDIDDRSKMSHVITITGGKPTIFIIKGIYPIPAVSSVNVIIGAPKKDNLMLGIYDIMGKMIKQQQVSVETGFNTIAVDITTLTKGSYIIKIIREIDTQENSWKFIK